MVLRPHDLRPATLYPSRWLLDNGAHPRDLASEQMTRAVPGFFMRTDAPAELRAIAEVVQRYVRPGAVISNETAAELLNFPLPQNMTRAGGAPIHCRITGEGTKATGPLLEVHVRAAAPTIRFHGLTISHPVTVLHEIAGSLPHADLVACVDAMAANRHGTAVRVVLHQIRELAGTLKGRGAHAVRRAAEDARERVWSPMETRMRLLILDRGYPEPVPNMELWEPVTGIVYYVDLAYPQWKIAIEYDGKQHRLDKEQWEKDLHKNEVLHDQHWKVLRISNTDFKQPRDFFLRLDAAIAERVREAHRPTLVTPARAGRESSTSDAAFSVNSTQHGA